MCEIPEATPNLFHANRAVSTLFQQKFLGTLSDDSFKRALMMTLKFCAPIANRSAIKSKSEAAAAYGTVDTPSEMGIGVDVSIPWILSGNVGEELKVLTSPMKYFLENEYEKACNKADTDRVKAAARPCSNSRNDPLLHAGPRRGWCMDRTQRHDRSHRRPS